MDGKIMKSIIDILKKSSGERAISMYLKKNTNILIKAFCTSWNYKICISDFSFGNEFSCDFLILCANSGFWTAIFIELEAPKATLYLKNGTPSKSLRIAQRQISDWKNWVRINEPYLRQSFVKYLKKNNVSAQCSRVDKHNLAETEIIDSHTVIRYCYKIIIGRRNLISSLEQERRANETDEIITFDRLIEVANVLDKVRSNDKSYKSNKTRL